MVIKNGERLLLRWGDLFVFHHQGWLAVEMLEKMNNKILQ